ncbi:glycoside hydrolase family 43 protein [Prevotella copri]|uniref:lipocalin-like domain-containing protein n=1 Tax=Segatella copri TaxID=165179 RepID=UPI0019332B53|nr:glycoside hydrolase family 43 protein [Segatella copri]MBM0263994.1 glycoside hydrolase family 43 protein [Segatella copri]
MKKLLLSVMSLMAMNGAMAQTPVGDNDLANAYATQTITGRIAVHDPSIVMDVTGSTTSSPKYYIYGSHLGRANTYASGNYQIWNTFKTGEENAGTSNSLFADVNGKLVNFKDAYSTQMVKKVKNYKGEEVDFPNFDAHAWQAKGNNVKGMQWAPDVIYNKTMKKWCMYMSLNGDNWCSTIVCFISDDLEGPWIYQGPVVCSGFSGRYAHNGFAASGDWKNTDLAIATGCTSLPQRYNTDEWSPYGPNCIDPCVFYDDDDNLWMSYGSWFAGIFMIKLDKENGLRDYTYTYPYQVKGVTTTAGAANANATSDPYFGKKIAGGWGVSGEASYIQKVGKYYYLFMSYGGLTAAGGYQIRVFRSEKPDGPYKDCLTFTGIDAMYGKYILNFGGDAKRDEGVKLFGNYQWETMPNAELAQGHNSAIVDHKGRALIVYHTRFLNRDEEHEVRVHQLFVNQDGWLVAAPYEFSGETYTDNDIATQQLYDATEVEGDYQIIAHPYRQNTAAMAYEKPVTIHLNADGSISGEYTGKWELVSGTSYINLTLKGVATANAEVKFKGVLTKQTIDYTNIKALCFTALSSSDGLATSGGASLQTRGLSIWGSKADAKAAIKYTLDKTSVPFADGATLNSMPKLSTDGHLGATISWKSSNPSILTDEGVVKGKGKVTMTMTISKDGYEYTKDYTLNIDAEAEETTPVYYPVSAQKNTTSGWWTNFSPYYELQAGKKMQFKFYNYSDMSAVWNNWCLAATQIKREDAGYGADKEYFVIRNDKFGWGANHNAEGFTNDFDWSGGDDRPNLRKDLNGSLVDMTVSLTAAGVFKMESTITTTTNKVYHYTYTTTLTAKPSKIILFFVNEKSYIDGSSLSTGISNPIIIQKKNDGKWYNLSGQQVDKSYKGVVIVNGKKFVNK